MNTEVSLIFWIVAGVFLLGVGAIVGRALMRRKQLAIYKNEVRKYAAHMEIIKKQNPNTFDNEVDWLNSLDQRLRCTIAEENRKLVGMRTILGLSRGENCAVIKREWGKQPRGLWGTSLAEH